MYLSLLNQEQKELFYSFAYNIAMSDNDFSVEEQALIDSYAVEMNLEFDESKVKNIDEVISLISSQCEMREKKIIIFEAVGLALADMNYEQSEKDIINKALRVFGLDREYGDCCEKQLLRYLKFQQELNDMILR